MIVKTEKCLTRVHFHASTPTLLKIKLFTVDIDRALVNKEVFADPLTTKYFVDPKSVFTSASDCV